MKHEINGKTYYVKSDGSLLPEELVRPEDGLIDDFVTETKNKLEALREHTKEVKKEILDDLAALIQTVSERYNVQIGGAKGNVTLHDFTDNVRLQRRQQERVGYGPGILAAQELISEYIQSISEGVDPVVVQIMNEGLRNKNGQPNINAIAKIRKLAIDDPTWQKAMQIIDDSKYTEQGQPFLQLYVRKDAQEEFETTTLDFSKL